MAATSAVEQETGKVYGDLWHPYDESLFDQSVELFKTRWLANGEPPDHFQGKRCLDAGCGGGRYSVAMALAGAESVVGVDVSPTGLASARQRAAKRGLEQISFQQASVLDLPFEDGEFDFVLCSGILHHTVGVERGLRELYRVVKPGGWVNLLLYGFGGLFWSLNLVMRPFAEVLGQPEVERCVAAAGLTANKRRAILDSLYCPILEMYTVDRVDFLLRSTGFESWRRWEHARLDHESSPERMIEELDIYVNLWQSGIAGAAQAETRRIIEGLADTCRAVDAAARELIEQHRDGLLTDEQLRQAIVGEGHHRIIAERPHES